MTRQRSCPRLLLQRLVDLRFVINDFTLTPSTAVHNLGVTFDPTLACQTHINNIIIQSPAFFHLRNILAETPVHTSITLCLVYCHSVLVSLSNPSINFNISKIQQPSYLYKEICSYYPCYASVPLAPHIRPHSIETSHRYIQSNKQACLILPF